MTKKEVIEVLKDLAVQFDSEDDTQYVMIDYIEKYINLIDDYKREIPVVVPSPTIIDKNWWEKGPTCESTGYVQDIKKTTYTTSANIYTTKEYEE